MVRLAIASIFTLGILFGFLLTLVVTITSLPNVIAQYYYGVELAPATTLTFLIAFTVVINFIIWLVSPKISDWLYSWLYKLQWINIDGLSARDKSAPEFL